MDPEMELTANHLRWDIYGTGVRDGVDPDKVLLQHDLSWDIDEAAAGDLSEPWKGRAQIWI